MTETKIVRMRTGVRIPAHVLDEERDVRVSKGEEPDLPAAYAQQLVDDGFAVFAGDSSDADDAEEPPDLEVDLSAMTKEQLLAEALVRGVTVKPSDSKAEIVAALTAEV